MPDESFKVRCFGDVHGRAGGCQRLRASPWTIHASGEEFVQDIVLIGGQDETSDRHAHRPGEVAGVDVAEIARWDDHIHCMASTVRTVESVRDTQPGPDVVDDLCSDAPEVNRINGADRVGRFEGGVTVDGLDESLAVIEDAIHCDVVNIGVIERVHLGALHIAHPILR